MGDPFSFKSFFTGDSGVDDFFNDDAPQRGSRSVRIQAPRPKYYFKIFSDGVTVLRGPYRNRDAAQQQRYSEIAKGNQVSPLLRG